jgi:hypothetical protein
MTHFKFKMIAAFAIVLSLTILGWSNTVAFAAKRPVTAVDSVMLKRPQDAQISPDGKWVAFHNK